MLVEHDDLTTIDEVEMRAAAECKIILKNGRGARSGNENLRRVAGIALPGGIAGTFRVVGIEGQIHNSPGYVIRTGGKSCRHTLVLQNRIQTGVFANLLGGYLSADERWRRLSAPASVAFPSGKFMNGRTESSDQPEPRTNSS